MTQTVDLDGCSEQQKDDDEDGIKNHVDECPNTPEDELINAVGCALFQLDSDQDGVNDAEDAFKFDANESVDTDNDGVADQHTVFAHIDNPRGLIADGDQLYVLYSVISAETDVMTGMHLGVLEDKNHDGIALSLIHI